MLLVSRECSIDSYLTLLCILQVEELLIATRKCWIVSLYGFVSVVQLEASPYSHPNPTLCLLKSYNQISILP